MTPEQILIDGLNTIINSIPLVSPIPNDFTAGMISGCQTDGRIASETLQAYNEAKAKEATVKENLTVQDPLTAHPLAKALRFYVDEENTGAYYSGSMQIGRGTPVKEILLPSGNLKPIGYTAQKALTQHEALIKQSEAVWAFVLPYFKMQKIRQDPTRKGSLWDSEEYMLLVDEMEAAFRAIPVEALEMMEVKS